jgi:hypothetical protein
MAHQGEYFMIPETSDTGVVEIYRAQEFPAKWALEKTLLDLPGLDSTPFFARGRWWMFTTPAQGQNHAAVTLLFSAPDLLGPWTHHPDSPICTDVRAARSAGPVLQHEGRQIRVSQDCSSGYGKRLVFSEILELTEHSYKEGLLKYSPAQQAGPIGTHTYNFANGWEVVDAKWLLPRRRVL